MMHFLLRCLAPEAAHQLTLWALQKGLGPKQPASATSFSLLGKQLAGRVGLAGGADKNAAALSGWRDMGFAFVEVGTVTLDARAGNPRPRIWRFRNTHSLVNWMGLPNLGADAVAANLARFRRGKNGQSFCVGASIASPSGIPDELQKIASKLCEFVDFFTLNASCPNVAEHCGENLLEPIITQLKAAIAGAGGKPVLVKLAPTLDEESLRATVSQLSAAGAAGFIACNTLPNSSAHLVATHTLPTHWPQHNGAPVGGYSGPALLAISTSMVRIIRSEIGSEKVIIAVGGIASALDAKRTLEAGADAIQLYTALTYQGPKLLKELNSGLS